MIVPSDFVSFVNYRFDSLELG